MRITRSTLRRLIAEESARLLREAAFPEEIEGVYGEEPPEDGGDGIPKMLHVMYRGFRPVFIVTDVDANPLGEEAEDVTQQIQPAKSNMTTPELAQAIIDFITDPANNIMYVFDEEMNDSETDEKFETADYVEHLEGLISSGEEEAGSRGGEMHKRAVERGEDEDLFEGSPKGDDWLDYDPEAIPDMDDQYDPDYWEGLDDVGDDEDFMDYETGEDDVPYGAADVALRQGRGYRTDEGHDHDMDDYEHAYSMGGGSDEEGFAIDYDVGRPSPFAAKMFGQPAAGADDIEGADADEDVFGDDDMGRAGARDDYHHAYKLGGGRDEEGFAADYDTGKKRQFPPARGGLSEARWAKLAGILKD